MDIDEEEFVIIDLIHTLSLASVSLKILYFKAVIEVINYPYISKANDCVHCQLFMYAITNEPFLPHSPCMA